MEMKDADGNVLCSIKDGEVVCRTGTFENVVFSGVAMKKKTIVTAQNFSSIFKTTSEADTYDIDFSVSGTWLDIQYLPGKIFISPKSMRALCGNTILLYNNSNSILAITTRTTQSFNGAPGAFQSFALNPREFASLECRIGAYQGMEQPYFLAQKGSIDTTLD